MTVSSMTQYQCKECGHAYWKHRESREWQLNNPRRKRNLIGCTEHNCNCKGAK